MKTTKLKFYTLCMLHCFLRMKNEDNLQCLSYQFNMKNIQMTVFQQETKALRISLFLLKKNTQLFSGNNTVKLSK